MSTEVFTQIELGLLLAIAYNIYHLTLIFIGTQASALFIIDNSVTIDGGDGYELGFHRVLPEWRIFNQFRYFDVEEFTVGKRLQI